MGYSWIILCTVESTSTMAAPTLVIDNGGCSCRVGWAHEELPSIVAPNVTAKQHGNLDVFVSDQIGRIKNKGTLTFTRPCDRGIITNWVCQTDIWKRLLPQVMKNETPQTTTLMMTYAPFTPDSVTSNLDEIVFEELNFNAFQRIPAPIASAALYHHIADSHQLKSFAYINDESEIQDNYINDTGVETCIVLNDNSSTHVDDASDMDENTHALSASLCCLVLDIGYSATYAIPCIRGQSIQPAIRRLNIGGKLMTCLLQETLSYRQYNMMDETMLVNDAKESLCYLASQNMQQEIESSVGSHIPFSRSAYSEWVLPTYQHGNDQGHLRKLTIDTATGRLKRTRKGDESNGQCLRIESERFTVPEVLFRPTDIGMDQSGLHQLIREAIGATDSALHPLLYSNIFITGGVSNLPHLLPRLYRELRPIVPDHYKLHIRLANNNNNNIASNSPSSSRDQNTSLPHVMDGIDDTDKEDEEVIYDTNSFAWKGAALIALNSKQNITMITNNLTDQKKKKKKGKKSNQLIFQESNDMELDIHDKEEEEEENPYVKLYTLTKSEYLEMGSEYCNEKFRYW